MTSNSKTPMTRLFNTLKAQFLVGILIVVPLMATILILVWVFRSVDDILRPLVVLVWHHYVPGIGFAATVILVYVAGVIGSSLVGKRFFVFSDNILDRVPIVRSIYSPAKRVLEGFSDPKASGFVQVVLVEYPRDGVKSIAFVTNEFRDGSGSKMFNVFIPTSPNPTSGFMRVMKSEDVTPIRLSVDEAVKMLVSFGRVAPGDLSEKLGSQTMVDRNVKNSQT